MNKFYKRVSLEEITDKADAMPEPVAAESKLVIRLGYIIQFGGKESWPSYSLGRNLTTLRSE